VKKIKLTEICIYPIKPTDKGLVAFASCIYNDRLSLNSIAIYTRPTGDGYRLVYPTRNLPNGRIINTFYPIERKAGQAIERAVILKFEEIIEKCGESIGKEINQGNFK